MLYLAFAKGQETFFDKMVEWRTGGIHTHVELVFSDGESFSSSQWDGGTRFKTINYSNKEKWDMVPIGIYGMGEKAIREYCRELLGRKYDWRTILRLFAGKKIVEDQVKLMCSETCHHVLKKKARIFTRWNSSKVTPEMLYIMAVSHATALGLLNEE